MRDESFAFLKKLLETPSPSGFETRGQRVWVDYTKQFADKIESDPYGNVFATLNGDGRPKILLGGHADELGLMITHISDDGFLYVRGIGGVDRGLLRGQRVIVHGRQGPVPGVVGHLAIHMQEVDDRKKVPEFHELFVDIAMNSKKEAEQVVRVGDAITLNANVERLANNRIVARACDNRVGTWAAAEAMRLIAAERTKLQCQVVSASTIQEENGLYGATMVGYRVRPDAAIIVDVTHSTDIPVCSKAKHGDVRLGKGPSISFGSANHPVLAEKLIDLAERHKIPVQYETNPRFTGTDADAFFLQRGGIPSISVGIPNRYMHSSVEIVDLDDMVKMAELLAAFCLEVQSSDVFAVKI